MTATITRSVVDELGDKQCGKGGVLLLRDCSVWIDRGTKLLLVQPCNVVRAWAVSGQ